MNLTTVIPCHGGDAERAEKLLDLILFLQYKQPEGYGVIALSPDVPQEMRDKLRLTAELVFETVEILNINPADMPKMERTPESKPVWVDAMFNQVVRRMNKAYKDPWVWLEPDCVPLKRNWKDALHEEYFSQPKRYLGVRLSYGEAKALTMHSVFPADALRDVEAAMELSIPFRFYAFDLSTRSKLWQYETITSLDDRHKISASTVLVHSDKAGVLIEDVMERSAPKSEYTAVEINPKTSMTFGVCQDLNIILNPPTNGIQDLAPEAAEVLADYPNNSEGTKIAAAVRSEHQKRRGRPRKSPQPVSA